MSPSAPTLISKARRSRTWPSAAPPNSPSQNGYDWFHVVTRSTDLAGGNYSQGGPTVGLGGSTGSYGSSLGLGLGFNFGGDSRQYQSTLEILMGRGAKPSDPNAYDAQQVLARTM